MTNEKINLLLTKMEKWKIRQNQSISIAMRDKNEDHLFRFKNNQQWNLSSLNSLNVMDMDQHFLSTIPLKVWSLEHMWFGCVGVGCGGPPVSPRTNEDRDFAHSFKKFRKNWFKSISLRFQAFIWYQICQHLNCSMWHFITLAKTPSQSSVIKRGNLI